MLFDEFYFLPFSSTWLIFLATIKELTSSAWLPSTSVFSSPDISPLLDHLLFTGKHLSPQSALFCAGFSTSLLCY
jgi:hypothetical protein